MSRENLLQTLIIFRCREHSISFGYNIQSLLWSAVHEPLFNHLYGWYGIYSCPDVCGQRFNGWIFFFLIIFDIHNSLDIVIFGISHLSMAVLAVPTNLA